MSGPPQPNRLTYPDFHPLSGQDLIIVHDHDILSGRGVNIAQHPGNERFRALVQSRSDTAYCKNYTSSEKKAVAEEIIQHIKRLNPPGRFLKRTGRSKNSRGLHGPWDELTDKEARKKTCQALRDCNRNDREGYAAAVSVPEDVIHSSAARQQTGLSNKEYAEQIAATTKQFVVPEANKSRAQPQLPLPSLPPPVQALPAMQTTHATPMSMVSSSAVAAVPVTAPATAAASNPSPPPPPPDPASSPKRSREVSTDGHMFRHLPHPGQFISPPTNEDSEANCWLKKQRTVATGEAAAPPNPSPPPPPPPSNLQQSHGVTFDHHMALLQHLQHQGQQQQFPPSVEVAAAAEWLKQHQQHWVHHAIVNAHNVAMNPVAAEAATPANPSPPPLSNPMQSLQVVHDNMLLHLPQTEQRKSSPSVEVQAAAVAAAATVNDSMLLHLPQTEQRKSPFVEATAAAAAAGWKMPQEDPTVKPQYVAIHAPAMPPPSTAASSVGGLHPEQDTLDGNENEYVATSFSAFAAAEAAAAAAADECSLSKSPLHHHHYHHANTSLPPSFPPSPATALAAANGDPHGAFDPATMRSIARAFQDEDIASVVAAQAPRQDPYFAMGEDPLFSGLHFHPATFSHSHLAQRRENNQAHNVHRASGSGGDDDESPSDGALFI